MLHISKSPKTKRYFVATVATNHLEVSCSQPTGLAGRKSVFKNIRSQMKTFNSPFVFVQDNSLQVPVVLKVLPKSTLVMKGMKLAKAYIPGPNPKAKKKK